MNFNRIAKFSIIGFTLIMALVILTPMAFSADKVIDATIDSVTTQLDKNGNEYTRIVVMETKKLQGVEYESGTPAMAFGSLNADVKDMVVGGNLKAVVATREYQGRTSYTIKALLP